MHDDELRQKIGQYKFYHIIPLAPGIVTPGNPKYQSTQQLMLDELRRTPLAGKRVLDIGCRDGLFSFEAERLGAAEVIGIDNDLSRPAVEFLIPFFNSKVRMVEMNVFDLRPDSFGRFDVVLFAGVLYHLRYPVWSLKLIRDVLTDPGRLLLETAIWRGDRQHAMLYCPVGEESPYEPTSCTYFNEKGLRVTLESLGFEVSAPHYRSQREPGKNFLRDIKQTLDSLARRARGLHMKTRIDRGLFACRYASTAVDPGLRQYWENTHDVHTQTGG